MKAPRDSDLMGQPHARLCFDASAPWVCSPTLRDRGTHGYSWGTLRVGDVIQVLFLYSVLQRHLPKAN